MLLYLLTGVVARAVSNNILIGWIEYLLLDWECMILSFLLSLASMFYNPCEWLIHYLWPDLLEIWPKYRLFVKWILYHWRRCWLVAHFFFKWSSRRVNAFTKPIEHLDRVDVYDIDSISLWSIAPLLLVEIRSSSWLVDSRFCMHYGLRNFLCFIVHWDKFTAGWTGQWPKLCSSNYVVSF